MGISEQMQGQPVQSNTEVMYGQILMVNVVYLQKGGFKKMRDWISLFSSCMQIMYIVLNRYDIGALSKYLLPVLLASVIIC